MTANIDMNRVLEVIEADEYIGFCLECGAERDQVEPDATGYKCDSCGALAVAGAEEVLLIRGEL